MTKQDKIRFCRGQYLYIDFYSDFSKQIDILYNTPAFTDEIYNIAASVTEETEFSSDTQSTIFKQFKSKIGFDLYNADVYSRFPEYARIYDWFKSNKKAGTSAAISVYYAIRCLDIHNDIEKKALRLVSSEKDIREKWKARWRCDDGHKVRSKNEQLVDNWLYSHEICHAYEKKVFDKENNREYISDFYVPSLKLYIEVWGIKNTKYEQRMREKIAVYNKKGYTLLSLFEDDICILDDVMSKHLL